MSKKFFAITLIFVGFFAVPVLAALNTPTTQNYGGSTGSNFLSSTSQLPKSGQNVGQGNGYKIYLLGPAQNVAPRQLGSSYINPLGSVILNSLPKNQDFNTNSKSLSDNETPGPNPKISNVNVALPRNASEGVFPGENIVVTWATRDIPKTAKMEIYIYELTSGAKGKEILISTDVLNSGELGFPVPSGLFPTTEPDYRPYKTVVQWKYKNPTTQKEVVVRGQTDGHFYVKNLGCPIFSFEPIRYENQKPVQDVIVESSGLSVKGSMTMKIFDFDIYGKVSRDALDNGTKNEVSIDLGKTSKFSLRSNLDLIAGKNYYLYFPGFFQTADGEEYLCVKRSTISAPKDFYANQEKKIAVEIPELATKKQFNYGDEITVKWNTSGLKPTDLICLSADNQSSGTSANIYHTGGVPKSCSMNRNMFFVKDGQKKIIIDKEFKSSGQAFYFSTSGAYIINARHYSSTGRIVSGRSDPFIIDKASIPVIKTNSIVTNQNGIIFDIDVTNLNGIKEAKCWLEVLRMPGGELTDSEKEEFRKNSTDQKIYPFVTDSITINEKFPKLKFYYPRENIKNNYSGYILYKTSARYKATLYCSLDGSSDKTMVSNWSEIVSPAKVRIESVKVERLGYYLSTNKIEVRGKIVYQGYSPDGVAPFVEFDTSKEGLIGDEDTGNYLRQDLTGVNSSAPRKLTAGKIFSIISDDIDTSKSIFYRVCATDPGDGFTKVTKYCTEIYQTEVLKTENNTGE